MNYAIKNTVNSLRQNKKLVILFFAIFYSVGFVGTVSSFTHDLFLRLFPLAIILSFFAILLFHDLKYDSRTISLLIIIALSGFLIEVAGISTHKIFGNYLYGETLGIKLFDTPLLIGINWVMLVFATGTVVESLRLSNLYKILLASGIMVFYDLLMESVAPLLGMWSWEGGTIPVKNYIAWLVIAVIMHTCLKVFHVRPRSSIALYLLTIQGLFFVLLIIFYSIK
jgi:bisanhydrobacterioruberin hydratase